MELKTKDEKAKACYKGCKSTKEGWEDSQLECLEPQNKYEQHWITTIEQRKL